MMREVITQRMSVPEKTQVMTMELIPRRMTVQVETKSTKTAVTPPRMTMMVAKFLLLLTSTRGRSAQEFESHVQLRFQDVRCIWFSFALYSGRHNHSRG